MTLPEPSPIGDNSAASKWHRMPDARLQSCSVCGCPAKFLGCTRLQEHRATVEGDDEEVRWVKRRKSPSGWKLTPINEKGPRPNDPAALTRERIIQATTILGVLGRELTLGQVGKIMGISGKLLYRARVRHPKVWQAELENVRRRYAVGFQARLKRATPQTVERIAQATAMLAVGESWEAVAQSLGVTVPTLREFSERHGGLWKREYDHAMGIVAAVRNSEPGPHYLRSVARQEKSGAGPPQSEPDAQTLTWFFQTYYRPLRLLNCSDATLSDYTTALKMLERYAGRPVLLSELSDELVAGFMAWRLESGLSAPTVNKQRATLLAIWRFAFRKKLIDTRADVERVKEFKRVPEAWSVEELGRILQAAGEYECEVCGIPGALWWQALILVVYDTGLRISPVMLIDRADLDLDTGWLHVPAEHQKNKTGQRFKLAPDTVAALAKIVNGSGPVFPWPHDRKARQWQYLQKRFRRILEAAGLPHGKRDLFHKIRRTSGTFVADKLGRAAAMDHLGHSGMAVTERYLDPTKIQRAQGADVLPRPELKRET